MKEERIKDLISKYKAGETSTEEELYLREHADLLGKPHESLLRFIDQHKTKAPKHFNEEQWNRFELKQKQRKMKRYSLLSVAASVVIVLGLFFMTPSDKKMTITEKQALLEEALLMLEPPVEENNQSILYEDELVIIYTTY